MEEENLRLKKLVADLSLNKAMLQDVLAKKSFSLSHLHEWNGSEIYRPVIELVRGKSALHCASVAAHFAIILWPTTTAHYACTSAKSSKYG